MPLVNASFARPCDFLGVEKQCHISFIDGMGRMHMKVKLEDCSVGIQTKVAWFREKLDVIGYTTCAVAARDPMCLQNMFLKYDTETGNVYLDREVSDGIGFESMN